MRPLLIALVLCSAAHAQAVPHPDIRGDVYHDTAAAHGLLLRFAKDHPNLVTVESIGETLAGTALLVATVTDRRSGPPEDKPAFYLDGNIHSGELVSGEVALFVLGWLVHNADRDLAVRDLLRENTFYIRPKFNPDGADIALASEVRIRSTPRPKDNDGDGKKDEDPAEDLNGDGFITSMRVPDAEGAWRRDSTDGRIMIRRKKDETDQGPYFRVLKEGLDNDGDGAFNEDGPGGLDMNRNFPRNWALEFKQSGAGPFPLSEPETLATVRFIDAHPNIAAIMHGHTSGGFVYRLPSASNPDLFDKDDIALIKSLGREFTATTARPVRPSATHPTRHRYGTLISWGYWDRGIIGWVPEYWPGLGKTEAERLKVDDDEFGGRYFVEWTSFNHPQLGAVEIGGWRSRFTSQNAPPERLAAECRLHLDWFFWLARQAPRIEVSQPVVTPLGEGRHSIELTVRNAGFLPTHLTRRGLEAKVVGPVIAEIELEGGRIVEGAPRTVVGHLAGIWGSAREDALPISARVRWVVEGDTPKATITVGSDKGGRRKLRVNVR